MPDELQLGAHLLGRKVMPKDDRDYKLADLFFALDKIGSGELTPTTTLEELISGGWITRWHDIYALWHYLKSLLASDPAPVPVPTSEMVWDDPRPVLNQGNTPHCVGFAWSQWANTSPVNDNYANADGNAVYYECKVIDGEPKKEDGSNTRSGAAAMKDRGRLALYAFAKSTDEITRWIQDHGPVVVGTNWFNKMFTPDADFYLHPTGTIAGGHEWLLHGYLPNGYGSVKEPSYVMLNSWGNWGQGGHAHITVTDFAGLLSDQGDACVGLELPLP